MALLPSFLTLGAMTLAALYCASQGRSAGFFVLLLLGAGLGTFLLRAASMLWAATRRTRPPRIIVLHLLKRSGS